MPLATTALPHMRGARGFRARRAGSRSPAASRVASQLSAEHVFDRRVLEREFRVHALELCVL
jgi:hypothetical protein